MTDGTGSATFFGLMFLVAVLVILIYAAWYARKHGASPSLLQTSTYRGPRELRPLAEALDNSVFPDPVTLSPADAREVLAFAEDQYRGRLAAVDRAKDGETALMLFKLFASTRLETVWRQDARGAYSLHFRASVFGASVSPLSEEAPDMRTAIYRVVNAYTAAMDGAAKAEVTR